MGRGTDYEGYVYVRGSHRKQGDKVKGATTALGSQGGDRLALAKSLVAKDNLLSPGHGQPHMALHVWSWNRADHGRLRTNGSDAFQPAASRLARTDFMENDWSVKRQSGDCPFLHLSSVEQGNPANSSAQIDELDPDNTGLYRMPIRRITSEAIRDSLLAHSGRLDRKMFGPSVAVHRTAFMTGRGGRGSGPADGAGRRSVYGSVYRNFLSPFMLAFDQPAPSGKPKAEGPFPTCPPSLWLC